MGQLEERDSFVFYKSFYDAIISIPDVETQMEIFKVLCEYSFTGNIPEINNGNVRALFIVMKPVVDKANNRYKANVENGKKGGLMNSRLIVKLVEALGVEVKDFVYAEKAYLDEVDRINGINRDE